jgi:hypothetical protein
MRITPDCTEEVFAYGMMVPSLLHTLKMVIGALATTSTYSVVVSSKWGRDTTRMKRDGKEALSITLMALSSNMTERVDYLILISRLK